MKPTPTKKRTRANVLAAAQALGHDPALLDKPEGKFNPANGKLRTTENLTCSAWVEIELMSGRSSVDLQREGKTRYGYASRTMRKYILKAQRRLAQAFRESETDLDALRAQAEAMLLSAHKVARDEKDAKGMVSATEAFLKVHGANRAEKVEVKLKGIGDMLERFLEE